MKIGDIFSYMDMCQFEKTTLQRGMNYYLDKKSILLMSLRKNAPYADRIEENAKKGLKPELVKVYEKLREGIWTYNR